MENKNMKKIISGIIILIALALGVIHPSDLLSKDSASQSAGTTQVEIAVNDTEEKATTAEPQKATTESTTATTTEAEQVEEEEAAVTFRNQRLLEEHFKKHGIEMGFATPEEYEKAAAAVVTNPKALHKLEAEDGDDVYYLEKTNEFVITSKDGYLRTYFNPTNGIKYYNKQ